MIAKGNLHAHGAKLASYMMTGKGDERAELADTRGLALLGANPVDAFATGQMIAAAHTQSTKPFFHTQTRLAPGEQLTREQWLHVADRQEARLGFTGQPRMVSFHHLADGSTHMHVAWFRIDLETMHAIDPGLFKNHLKELSRTLEAEFDLTRVRNERAENDRTRAPNRGEFEEARRLGIDLKQVRNTILDCLHQSDCGKAFNAALEAHGLLLANGNRRDCFVVVDPAGGHHALNKKLTGLTQAAIRNRLSDIDRTQLPSVEQAQLQQRGRANTGGIEMEITPSEPNGAKTILEQHLLVTAGEARVLDFAEERASEQASRDAYKEVSRAIDTGIYAAASAGKSGVRATRKLLGGASKVVEAVIGAIASFFGDSPAKLTRQQVREKRQADGNVETRHARTVADAKRENEVEHDWRLHAAKTAQQEKDLRLAQTLGTTATQEANHGRDEYDRVREQERGRERGGRSF